VNGRPYSVLAGMAVFGFWTSSPDPDLEEAVRPASAMAMASG